MMGKQQQQQQQHQHQTSKGSGDGLRQRRRPISTTRTTTTTTSKENQDDERQTASVVRIVSHPQTDGDDDSADSDKSPERRTQEQEQRSRQRVRPSTKAKRLRPSNLQREKEESLLRFLYREIFLVSDDDNRQKDKKKKDVDEGDDTTMILLIGGIVLVSIFISISVLYLLVLVYNNYYIDGSTTTSNTTAIDNDEFPTLPSSKIYAIPYSMAHIGDKSDEYATLRKEYDAYRPLDDYDRSLMASKSLRNTNYDALETPSELPYDIHNCPYEPPIGYPYEYPTIHVLQNWPSNYRYPPADSNVAHLGICVFDYGRDYIKALNYKRLEVPFVVQNDPRVAETVERWSNQTYTHRLFNTVGGNRDNSDTSGYWDRLGADKVYHHRAEKSYNLEFLYWRPDIVKKKEEQENDVQGFNVSSWKQPTQIVQMSYEEWYAISKEIQEKNRGSSNVFLSHVGPYYYFRLIGCGETSPTGTCDNVGTTSEYLFDELPYFQPKRQELYLTEPSQQRGIHCRFGVDGIQAQNHFDSSRNSIVVLGGQRRYVLSHPRSCVHQAMYPIGHPSARHSQINWTQVGLDEEGSSWNDSFPQFRNSTSNEVVLQAGDVLYLPTNWFHYIISLSLNYQCNTRSGRTTHYDLDIEKCGFHKTSSDGTKKHTN
jgi:hypothetical protein